MHLRTYSILALKIMGTLTSIISPGLYAAIIQIDCGHYNDKGVVIYVNEKKIGACPIGAVVEGGNINISTNMYLKDGRQLVGEKEITLADNAIKNVALPIKLIETLEYRVNESNSASDLLSLYNQTEDINLQSKITRKVREVLSNVFVESNESIETLNSSELSEWKKYVVPQMFRITSSLELFYQYNILISKADGNNTRERFWIAEKARGEESKRILGASKIGTEDMLELFNEVTDPIGFKAIKYLAD